MRCHVKVLASLALARSGESNRSAKIADDLGKSFPQNTVINRYWLPTIRAAIEIDRGNAAKAIEMLRAAIPYELGYPNPEAEGGRYLYPIYVRAQAYFLMHRYHESAAEFQKILDHPSLTENCPFGALAHLGMARAALAAGDKTKARSYFQEFLTLWRDADRNIPILVAAKSNYAKLQ